MKKTIFILVAAALLFSIFAISAFATEAEVQDTDLSSDTAADTTEESIEANVFDAIFAAVSDYSGEILSAISAVLSGIVIFAYRKGILPLLSGGLSAVESEVKEIEKHSKSQNECTAALTSALSEGLSRANELLNSLEERISNAERTYKSTDEVFSVLFTQIELLSEIFLSSSLPAYEKERVAEKISEMKATLPKKTGENKNV